MEELLNELNEVVYVIELESYKLLYLNKYGLKLYGYEKFSEIERVPCYKAFYGKDSPCSFCNSSIFTNKKYHEWECENPLLNKYFIVKEKLIKWNGRNAYLVIAVDITRKEEEKITLEQTLENERVVLNCIKMMHSSVDIDVSITNTLKVIGEYLKSERTYIFELTKRNTLNNTYEWCADGITEAKDSLQEVPIEEINRWIESFKQGLPVIIKNLEDIKDIYKYEYATLSPQNINSLIIIPLMDNGIFLGFFGVDNPPVEKIKNIADTLSILSYFFLEMIQRKKLMATLENLSYYDTLTGALNRNAYIRDLENSLHITEGLGVVFIDVNGLKETNDHFGHAAGDELIINTFNEIKKVFKDDLKYRTGGDEFIVFCRNESENKFLKKIAMLKENLRNPAGGIASVGGNWTASAKNVSRSIKLAEINMYKDKERFYNYQVKNDKNLMIKRHYFQKLDENQ